MVQLTLMTGWTSILRDEFQKFRGSYLQGTSEFADGVERGTLLRPFQRPYVVPVKVRQFRELLLRHAPSMTERAQLLPEEPSRAL